MLRHRGKTYQSFRSFLWRQTTAQKRGYILKERVHFPAWGKVLNLDLFWRLATATYLPEDRCNSDVYTVLSHCCINGSRIAVLLSHYCLLCFIVFPF